jgi:hypothetical protein
MGRYKINIEGQPMPSSPALVAENNNSIMIAHQGAVSDTQNRQHRSYIQARHITGGTASDILIEKTTSEYNGPIQYRQILSLVGFENKYIAVTGETGGSYTTDSAPVRLFVTNNNFTQFELMSEIRIPNGIVSNVHVDIFGQQGIMVIQSRKQSGSQFNFYRLNLDLGLAQEITSLETSYTSDSVDTHFIKLDAAGFTLAIRETVPVTLPGGGIYLENNIQILRTEDYASFIHNSPFPNTSLYGHAYPSVDNLNVYRTSNVSTYVPDSNGYLFIDNITLAERYDGSSVTPINLKLPAFRYPYGTFASHKLMPRNDALYVLSSTSGAYVSPEYTLFKTNNDGQTWTQSLVTRFNPSVALFHMAKINTSIFVIGVDQKTSETLIYCGQQFY